LGGGDDGLEEEEEEEDDEGEGEGEGEGVVDEFVADVEVVVGVEVG